MQQALSRRLLAPWFVLLHIRCTTSGGTSDHWRSWSHCFSSTDTSASISSSSCCNYSNAAALATCIREQRLEWAWSSDNFRNMNSPCSSPITDNERAPRGALLQWNEHESGDDAIEAANAEFARLFRRDYHVVPPGDDFYHEGYFRGEVVHSLARAYTYVWVLPAGTVLVDSTEDWFATMEAMGSNNTWIGSSGPELDGSLRNAQYGGARSGHLARGAPRRGGGPRRLRPAAPHRATVRTRHCRPTCELLRSQ